MRIRKIPDNRPPTFQGLAFKGFVHVTVNFIEVAVFSIY